MCVLCLGTRLDQDRETLDRITAACIAQGFDVDVADDESTFIREQLTRRAPTAESDEATKLHG